MTDLTYAGNQVLYLVLLLSAPPILVATIVGLTVGLFQTVTQLQEQTLPFGVKLLAVCLCLFMLSGWIGESLLNFSREMFSMALRS
ncbi:MULTISPECIES: EscS/YscS/HrcS family type III secretion system export apparatus protein [unclassified Undibacterium]|uniref:EscS/YscS/HrcS family type III secretion system export apparatus protein n=1 Tax=unclassified Undibacterium TaxID=2630295 RepID=UPI002AC8A0C6|nr:MULTISPECIES: EscS/YscS/HrcS family type III secretion system export apparatus protein [unclassified Undibacterium]MEB0140387.1 EscS/YscS/HrcS family type III secretion system export apparatus protein [Undibacterium sp. CCC2.1]MEB0173421.1 EscS/YscS/HrcS family type III secretion system export apparatus protein [Undibacterium sp. CCC1.1]MEB0177321.1 EscS/YscS/HrcS family type III secretion system export apparatus protein [Undibacterium sp. CCC3.4]MEB0216578.1 EscS/YscS/HrcS family type III s